MKSCHLQPEKPSIWGMDLGSDNPVWQGSAVYYNGISAKANDVILVISPLEITMTLDGAEIIVPRNDFQITQIEGNGFIRIEFRNSVHGALQIQNSECSGYLHEFGFVKKISTSKNTIRRLVVLCSGIIAFVVFSYFFLLPPLTDYLVKLIPPKTEENIGTNFALEYMVHHKINSNDSIFSILTKYDSVLTYSFAKNPYYFKINIVEDTSIVNAFALPGGRIIVYRGLLNKIDSEQELLGVLFHEAGHVYLRHGMKRIVRAYIGSFFLQFMMGGFSNVSSVFAKVGNGLMEFKYDRAAEADADRFAVNVLNENHITSTGLVKVFTKLEYGLADKKWIKYISTHPPTAERIEELRSITKDFHSPDIVTPEEWKILKTQK